MRVQLDLRFPPRRVARRVRDTVALLRSRWTTALLMAALGAVVAGLVGAAAGQWVGWRTAGPLPTDDEAAAIAGLALGGPVSGPERREEPFGYGPEGYDAGYVRFTVPADTRAAAFEWRAKDVRVRLDTAGWRVDRVWEGTGLDSGRRAGESRATRPPEGVVFVADKGDWRVRYSVAGADAVHLDIVRAQPIAVLPAGALGGLLAAGLGWFVAGWATRRRATLGRWPRRAATALAGLGAAALLPALVVTAVRQISGYAVLARPQIPLWTAGAHPVLRSLLVVAAVALVAALATVAVARIWTSTDRPTLDQPVEVNGG
jgi:hypothetical protein